MLQALDDLREANTQKDVQLAIVRADLKNAQEEFNSARQISLQKQSELQAEVNQMKMSSELKEKDIERLNQVLSAEKSQRDAKLQEIQQQLEDTMNELEAAKSSQRSLEMNCKIVESERKNMGDRLQAWHPRHNALPSLTPSAARHQRGRALRTGLGDLLRPQHAGERGRLVDERLVPALTLGFYFSIRRLHLTTAYVENRRTIH